MNKCKCIQSCKTQDGQHDFTVESFYNFDYIPPTGEKPPFYRVFDNNGLYGNFDYLTFHKFFKKY